MTNRLITVLFLMAILPVPAYSGTIHVPAEQPTIQQAIDVSFTGDTILVAPGTYNENIDYHGKSITVSGAGRAEETIINGNNGGAVVTMQTGEGRQSVLTRLTIQHGNASFGPGLILIGASPRVTENIFRDNTNTGGAAIGGNGASPLITRNTFYANSCDNQVLSGVVSFINTSSPLIFNNVVRNNPCRGINMTLPEGSSPVVANNTIIGNSVGVRVDARIPTSEHLYANNIVVQNGIGLEVDFANPGNAPRWFNNDVFLNTNADYSGVPDQTGTNGNIAANPMLFNDADPRPTDDSPVIDAGILSIPELPSTDFDGKPRVVDGDSNQSALPDMGAFESAAEITFVPGDYYASKGEAFDNEDPVQRTVRQHDSATFQAIGHLTIPIELADEIRGTAFGPDNLFYVVVVKDLIASVLALDSSGTVQHIYPIPGNGISGGVYYGKIAFDRHYLYVGGPLLVRYALGDPQSGVILPTPGELANDVKPLPNGNLLVAMSSRIDELTVDGALVRHIPLVTTPFQFFNDVRGVEFDPITNSIFVTHLGYTGFESRLMRIDATTGVLEKDVFFITPLDILLDLSGDLVVTSSQEVPRFFTHDLDQMGTLGTEHRYFVTRFVPWPTISDLPQDAIVGEAAGPEGGPVDFTLTSTDLEGNANIVHTQPASGSIFPIGTTAVSATAIDRQSHITSAAFDVLVGDTTPPVITAPASIRIKKAKTGKGQPQGAVVNFADQLFASDLVDGVVGTVAAPSSGTFFPLGTTMVSVTAEDSHGNQSQTSFPVNVTKTVPKAKKPTVNLSFAPTSIAENENASLIVTATAANPSRPTVVNFQISGTAIPANQFYTLSRGQFLIPAGASSAAIILHSTPNSLSTGSETVTITLVPGSGYKVGKTKSATLTINNR